MKVGGAIIGGVAVVQGAAQAFLGLSLWPAGARLRTAGYWDALVWVFGDEGAPVVAGAFWLVLGLLLVYLSVMPDRFLPRWWLGKGPTPAAKSRTARRHNRA